MLALPRKILIVKLDNIGDVVLVSPLIEALKKNIPGLILDILIRKECLEVVSNNPDINKIHIINPVWKKVSLKNLLDNFRFISLARHNNYDYVVDFRGELPEVVFSRLCAKNNLIGYDLPWIKFMFDSVIRHSKNMHMVYSFLEVARLFGIKCDCANVKMFLNKDEKRGLDSALAENDIKNDFVIISPGASCSSKMWEEEKWGKVADFIIDKYKYSVICTGLRNENGIISKITYSAKNRVHNLAGKLSLTELAILIKYAKLIISVDSAAVHIASCFSVPTIALYGLTNPGEWGPFQEKENFIVIRKEFPCQDCNKINCDSRRCMKSITTEDVVEAIEKLSDRAAAV